MHDYITKTLASLSEQSGAICWGKVSREIDEESIRFRTLAAPLTYFTERFDWRKDKLEIIHMVRHAGGSPAIYTIGSEPIATWRHIADGARINWIYAATAAIVAVSILHLLRHLQVCPQTQRWSIIWLLHFLFEKLRAYHVMESSCVSPDLWLSVPRTGVSKVRVVGPLEGWDHLPRLPCTQQKVKVDSLKRIITRQDDNA